MPRNIPWSHFVSVLYVFATFRPCASSKKFKVSVAVTLSLKRNLMFICCSIFLSCDMLRKPPIFFFSTLWHCNAAWLVRWLGIVLWYVLSQFTCVVNCQGQYLREHSRYLIATSYSAWIIWSVTVGQESIRHQPVCAANHISQWYQIEDLSESRVFAPYRSDLSPVNFFFLYRYVSGN